MIERIKLKQTRFDAERYLKDYPDVRELNIDPFDYHTTYGVRLNRTAYPAQKKLRRIVFVISDISTIGGVPNRTRLVLSHVRGREISYKAITLSNEFGKKLDGVLSMAEDSEKIRSELSRWSPDDTVFIVSNNMLKPFPVDIRDRVKNFPIVYFSAGQLAFFLKNSPVLSDLEYVTNFRAMKIVSLSDADINFQRQLGIFGQVKGTVPVAQRAQNTYSLSRNKRLGYVGRIDFHAKDCMKLVEVAQALRDTEHLPIYIFTTDGRNSPGYNIFRKALRDANLEDKFHFEVNCTDKERIFSEISVLLLPSKMEGFGNVVVEAFSYGIPVVAASYAPGPAETIEDGRSGFLLDEFTGSAVLEKLSLLSDRRRQEMSSYAFERHKRYSLDQHVKFLEKICQEAVDEFDGENRYQVYPRLLVAEMAARRIRK